jgi:hypothetical protein
MNENNPVKELIELAVLIVVGVAFLSVFYLAPPSVKSHCAEEPETDFNKHDTFLSAYKGADMDGELRSKRLAKSAENLMGLSFVFAWVGVFLLMFFFAVVKPAVGEPVGLLVFSALFFTFSFTALLFYIRAQCLAVREQLREYIAAEMRQKPATSGAHG